MNEPISFPRIISFSQIFDIVSEMREIGVSEIGIDLMKDKADLLVIRIDNVPSHSANILKQEMLALDGEAAVNYSVCYRATRKLSSILLIGAVQVYKKLIPKLKMQSFKSLQTIADNLKTAISNYLTALPSTKIGKKTFNWADKTYVMGIINATTDSFSGDGIGADVKKALKLALEMQKAGADLLDIGAESTRRFSIYHKDLSRIIDAETEAKNLVPIIKALKKEISIPISVDTYKAFVAEKAIKAGASVVNDIWGLQADEKMSKVITEHRVSVIIMHNQEKPIYQNARKEVFDFLYQTTEELLEAGAAREKIIIDPGLGFAKTTEHSLILLKHLKELRSLGFPILIGVSRKSVVGQTLNLPVLERLAGSLAANAVAVLNGANILRVHDVKETKEAVKMIDAIKNIKERIPQIR